MMGGETAGGALAGVGGGYVVAEGARWRRWTRRWGQAMSDAQADDDGSGGRRGRTKRIETL
jgi:hypothetical protein